MTLPEQFRSVRVFLGITVVFLALLISSARLRKLAKDWDTQQARRDMDEISRNERLFAGVKKQLPARGVVGYREYFRKGSSPDKESRWKQAFLTQYAVAPVLVDFNRNYPLTIDHFRDRVKVSRHEGK
jgi:antibiotic biosynthesis monooxygenase (ABM) superfamily enzyme